MFYRMYVITGPGCRTVPVDVNCLDDAAACEVAQGMVESSRSVEVWKGSVLVSQMGPGFVSGAAPADMPARP